MAYFKISSESETGKIVGDIFDRCDVVQAKRIAFMKKVGSTGGNARGDLIEGLSGLFFEDEVDRKEWKYYNKALGLYEPKKSSKIRKEWDEVGKVLRNEFDIAIGNKNWFSTRAGFCTSKDKEWYLVDVNLSPKHTSGTMELTKDCIEIVTAEYKGLEGADE